MRKKIIAGNWKMNSTKEETKILLENLKNKVSDKNDVLICVPFINIDYANNLLKDSNILISAQNVHHEDSGAFTGEVSAKMLKCLDINYSLIGHSERRQFFSETDQIVNKKVLKCLEIGINPIICVGENLLQKEQNIQVELIRMQVKIALLNVKEEDIKKITIAYEPIWAIGTGKTSSKEQAQEICFEIRKVVKELYNKNIAEEIRIQYGGSVTIENASSIFEMDDIDGGLIGGASLKEDFYHILNL